MNPSRRRTAAAVEAEAIVLQYLAAAGGKVRGSAKGLAFKLAKADRFKDAIRRLVAEGRVRVGQVPGARFVEMVEGDR